MDSSDSTSNGVVEFLLERNYLLTAFELLHELLEDGQVSSAFKLKQFFSDPDRFPPDQLLEMQSLPALDTRMLCDEKDAAVERAAVSEYELRLAREDLRSLQNKLEQQAEARPHSNDYATSVLDSVEGPTVCRNQIVLGPALETERKDLNAAVKEYLVASGYKVTAMTFVEEVDDQDLDKWHSEVAQVPNALRQYYRFFLSSSTDQVEKLGSLKDENKVLTSVKGVLENDKLCLSKQLESSKKEIRERDIQVAHLKESLERTIQEANEFRAEVTSLKLHLDRLKSKEASDTGLNISTVASSTQTEAQLLHDFTARNSSHPCTPDPCESVEVLEHISKSIGNASFSSEVDREDDRLKTNDSTPICQHCSEKQVVELETVHILAEALPKIVPYVLINHREELLPLMICAIERHPESAVRDSLTHHLFNLIKRPDELQRRIIMDACVSLSKSVGEMRTETELLPQCWEQINHKYEERRLLVAQSCGELGQFVRPEMCASLILSIIQQLVEDSAAIVREAAAHNLALLLPLFSNMDKYFKVEELLFQLVSDPSRIVVEETVKTLLPAILLWIEGGNRPLLPLIQSLISHLFAHVERCPPVSGVEGSPEARLRTLGEKERWSVNVLLKMLSQLLPAIKSAAVDSFPFKDALNQTTTALSDDKYSVFQEDVVKLYAESGIQWPVMDWMFEEFFPAILQLACMLPAREEILRTQICTVLFTVHECFGACYHSTFSIPFFLAAVGDTVDTRHLSPKLEKKITGMKPVTQTEEQLVVMGVLPLLLAGVLSAPTVPHDILQLYLKDLVLQSTAKYGAWRPSHTQDLIDAVRFLCTFKEQHGMIMNVLWELVVNAIAAVKVTATVIIKALVGYADLKLVTQQVLPALVTLASDPNVEVKHSSIEAFGSVAQHFKDEAVIDKIRVQMDAFLEDGSHEAIIAVVRTLAAALPLSASSLRDYLLQKLLVLSAAGTQVTSLMKRQERADAFCEAIRALDATDLSAVTVKELLVPTVSNLLRDSDSLDPAHKEALEVILKERSVNRLESISKVMAMSTMGSIFGEGGFLSKKEPGEDMPSPTLQSESGMLKRMMRNNYGGNIFSRSSGTPEH